MITTTYTCDKCGATQDSSKQMWCIGISVDSVDSAGSPGLGELKRIAHWCRLCTEKAGFLPRVNAKPEEITQPTLEELVKEIVRDEIQSQ